ncbi:MAG: hypothetical protein R3330_04465 [Saprospiraceae bacterium]|nr:hypothetical protein [Saprospiraceae bacterium]
MNNQWKRPDKDTEVFYKDMRFWLILLLLLAFLVFTLVRYPG